jgi:hypothetical protein
MPRFAADLFGYFMDLAIAADPRLPIALKKTIGQSKLKPLVDLLQQEKCDVVKIRACLERLAKESDSNYATKANKYKKAIYYVERTYPGFTPADRISVRPQASEAAMFLKEYEGVPSSPPQGDTSWKPFVRESGEAMWGPHIDPTKFKDEHRAHGKVQRLGMTVEDYLLKHPNEAILLIIHMQNKPNGADKPWDGSPAEDHILSVVQVAQALGVPLCILRFPIPRHDLYPGLGHKMPNFNTTRISQNEHSCVAHEDFRRLLVGKRTVVVLGYQADVCVSANVFGSTQLMEAPVRRIDERAPRPTPTLVPALVNIANVVTSRPMLFNDGEKIDKRWGPVSRW